MKLDGTPPKFAAIIMTAEPPCVKANPTPVVPPVVVTGEHGALANVVVYVKSGLQNYRYDVTPPPAVLDQKNCMYTPRVVAMMNTEQLQIGNEDPTTHNVHPMPKINKPWNRSIPPESTPLEVTFQKPELAIQVMCNVHAWMRAYLFVFAHPYYAITTKSGDFELKGIPPGTYTIEAWQERYGIQDQTVTLGPKEAKAISFAFKAADAAAKGQ